ncbi:DUF4760 domain-containing protein [Acinetobacter pullicarnis]|uniref:DUF4760 domain-containing protein n=1 Tax=Acinetobacter pullicarnis TaxID=2576829 RepID=UPI00111DEE16|nr:DUF4760 domain-containing protein [Acinetobacter pullicarnis]
MEIDNIILLRTLILVIPFLILFGFFYSRVRDTFFLKPRTDIQINIIMICLAIVFIETVYWNIELKNYEFFGYDLNSSSASDGSNIILISLGILAAVFGWLFTYRGQVLTATRSHSIQTLMASRLSNEYMEQVRFATEVYNNYKNNNLNQISHAEFNELTGEKIAAILYLLNYLEFISVGIRFGDLDEKLMKNTMKSIIGANYTFFEQIIKEKQAKSPSLYEHLTALNNRWNAK